MQVTFQHREVQEFGGKSYYVDCTALFSEEEKAVIRNREFGRGIRFSSPRRAAGLTGSERAVSTIWMFTDNIHILTVFVPLGGFLWASVAINGSTSFFGPLFVFGAPVLYLVGKYMAHRDDHSTDQQLVTFDDLFAGRPFTVWAFNPMDAKEKEKEVEGTFARLKQQIKENTELGEKRTVEL